MKNREKCLYDQHMKKENDSNPLLALKKGSVYSIVMKNADLIQHYIYFSHHNVFKRRLKTKNCTLCGAEGENKYSIGLSS
ncbi:MAG: hypothetical protein HUJ74_00205 [Lachnospiraceae bacterium]|nr:hypothetical protein [Lachnospiraceae bacterium]